MDLFNIDPHNDDLGNRVKAAKAWLAHVRKAGAGIEPAHFPERRRGGR